METTDAQGRVRLAGECLLGVWSPPLYEDNTCSQYVRRGTFAASPLRKKGVRGPSGRTRGPTDAADVAVRSEELVLPEEILDMNADEFRSVLREVLQEEFGARPVALGGRWQGGELIFKPGKEGTAEKRVGIDSFFHKIVMIRDRLRVLEQKINGHASLTDEEKVNMQQYITQCYGSLTTFNVFFADRNDGFVGQKGDD